MNSTWTEMGNFKQVVIDKRVVTSANKPNRGSSGFGGGMIIAVPRALLRIKASCVTHTIIRLKTNTYWCPSFQIASFFNQVHLTFRWS